MRKLDIAGMMVYIGLAGVVVSLVVLLAVVTMVSLIFGA